MQKLPKKMRGQRKIRDGYYKCQRGFNKDARDLQEILEQEPDYVSDSKVLFEWTNLDTNHKTQIPVSDEKGYAKKLEEFMFPDIPYTKVKDDQVPRHRFRMELKSFG